LVASSLVVAALVAMVVALPAVLRGLITQSRTSSELLDRPLPGQVAAEYLADGTPVWVVTHRDGSTDVVSGFDTHVALGIKKLLWWCPLSRSFENPHHGSAYDEYGVKYSGPAPASLSSWSAISEDGKVAVGDARPAPPIRVRTGGVGDESRHCTGTDQVTVHTFPGWRIWQSPRGLVAAAHSDWELVAGHLQRIGNQVMLCSLAGCDDVAPVEGVTWPPPVLVGSMEQAYPDLVWLVRVRDGHIVDFTRIIKPQGWTRPGD
jgi:hypothetical protein